jgi:putative aldouronate transport system permease protein
MVNKLVEFFGGQPILFMVSNTWFRTIIIGSDVWKTFGYGAIVYLAAISNVDPNIYEAAAIDGANRFEKIWHIILPSISSTIILLATLSLGSVLNAGFDQIYNMYTPLVYETGDIIDTYVYRMGLQRLQFSFATAVGLLKSVVSFILLVISYKLAAKFAGYTLF